MHERKVVIIGLELGDGQLIDEWARAGRLPYLQKMMADGCWSWLETTADQLHISAWPSLYTGASPGEHGVYFTFQPKPGQQGYQRFHEGLFGRPSFWQLLDKGGKRCSVFDPPYSHPEPGYNGRFIYDWGTWAHYLKTGSVPASLVKQLERANVPYPLGIEANDLGMESLDSIDISRRLVQSVEVKAKATCWLMREAPADLVFTVFGESHVAGHYCWTDRLQSGAERNEPSPMLTVYQALDCAIEQIRAASGPEATVIVISGDRVGPNHAGCHLLPDILERLGYLGTGLPELSDAVPARGFDPVKALRDLLPKGFRKTLARCLPTHLRDKLAQRVDTADIDWSRTQAYCLPTDLEGCIRINLKGREPRGTVEPGNAYESLLGEVTDRLREMTDPTSGRPIVKEVVRTDRVFPGERRDYLPDLIVQWDMSSPITGAASARFGTLVKPSPDPRPGTHRGPGFVLASGPEVPRGQTLQARNILDLAPTILTHFGVPVPGYMHGRVWPELLSDRIETRRDTQ
jgi:predicted AlkP superfamily phosphohydrolase/phosphomutase